MATLDYNALHPYPRYGAAVALLKSGRTPDEVTTPEALAPLVAEAIRLALATYTVRTLDDPNSAEYVPLDFAVGVRAYPFREWLYAELAYGFVGTTHDYDLFARPDVSEKERGFSYAVGVRTPAWRGVYAGAALGRAFGDEDRWLYDESPLSRFGMTLGIELGR